MNRFKFILPILLAVAACSRDDGGATVKNGIWAVEMQAGFAGGSVSVSQLTRSSEPFNKPFDLFLTQTATTPGGPSLTPGKYDVTGSEAFTLVDGSGNTIYWDDIGGRAAKLSFVAVYPKGSTGTMAYNSPDVTHQFDFEVEQDQSQQTDFIASDLLISKWTTGYTVSEQNSTAPAIVEFSHVLSKVTFVISKSTEFDDNDSAPSLEIVYPFNRKGTVTIPAASPTGSVAISGQNENSGSMTPHKINEGEFEVVVMPGNSIVKDAKLAVATISREGVTDPNTYNIYAPSEITALEPGKDYRFNVTINKTGGKVTADVKPWVKGDELTDNKVGIDIEPGSGTNTGLANGALFLMSVGGENTTYTYNNPNEWKGPAPAIYWDNIVRDENLIAEGVLYNHDDHSDIKPEYIYEGKTAKGDLKNAISLIQFSGMTSPFARINLEIKTPTAGDNKVDLSKISKIEFHSSLKKFADLDIEPLDAGTPSATFRSISYAALGTITLSDGNTSTSDNHDWFKANAIYIQPVTVTAAESSPVTLLTVTTTDNSLINDYPMVIKENAEFKANHEYTITLTLHKTEIAEVGVTIKGWDEGGGITGDGTIDK